MKKELRLLSLVILVISWVCIVLWPGEVRAQQTTIISAGETIYRLHCLRCHGKAGKVKATFKDGILEVKLPKTEDAKKRHVTVKIE